MVIDVNDNGSPEQTAI